MTAQPAPAYTRLGLTSILLSALLGYATDGYNLLILSFLMPYIDKTMHLSGVQAGSVFSVQLIASILGGALFGQLGDRIGRRNGLMLSIVLFSVGALLSGLSWNYESLLAFRLLTGIGLGGEFGLGMALFSEAWPRTRRGLGAGVIQASFLVGIFCAGIVASHLVTSMGPHAWRIAFMTGFLPVVLGIGIRFWMPESHLWQEYDRLRRSGELPSAKQRQRMALIEIFRGSTLRHTVFGFLMVFGFMLGFYALTSFVPTLIVSDYHSGASTYAAVNTAVVWISIPFYVAVGAASDIWGRKKSFIVPMLGMVAGSVFLLIATGSPAHYPGSIWVWPVFWAYCLWYAGSGVASLFGVWLSEIFPVEKRATAVSVTYMMGRGASAISPIIVPLLLVLPIASGAHPLGTSMALLSVVGVAVMTVFGLLLPETSGRVLRLIDYGDDRRGRAEAAPTAHATADVTTAAGVDTP
jgi:MFS family permease